MEVNNLLKKEEGISGFRVLLEKYVYGVCDGEPSEGHLGGPLQAGPGLLEERIREQRNRTRRVEIQEDCRAYQIDRSEIEAGQHAQQLQL